MEIAAAAHWPKTPKRQGLPADLLTPPRSHANPTSDRDINAYSSGFYQFLVVLVGMRYGEVLSPQSTKNFLGKSRRYNKL